MTTQSFATLASLPVQRVELHVPGIGPWWADVDMMEVTAVPSGKVALVVGDTTLTCSVVVSQSGTFGNQRKVRVLAGAGGWGNQLPAKSYHNDAGVKARTVLEDAAREAGETLASDAGGSGRVGADFIRRAGPASDVARYVSRAWYVDYQGVTHTGDRATVTARKGAYEVLSYAPRDRVAELALDSLGAVQVGYVLSERLDEPQTIKELRVVAEGTGLRAYAWTGDGDDTSGKLSRALKSVVKQAAGSELWGIYRYRVISMSSPKVKLQAVTSRAGLPNILPCDQHPGAAGWHAELTPGTEVLVQFVDGDAAQPIITSYAGKGQGGHVPASVTICGGTMPIARQGDLVLSGGLTTQLLFTTAPGDLTTKAPLTTGVPYYMYSMSATAPVPVPYLPGTVSTGNTKVKA